MTERPIGEILRENANAQIHKPFIDAVMHLVWAHLDRGILPGLTGEVNSKIRHLHHQHSITAGFRLRMITFAIIGEDQGRLSMEGDLSTWTQEPYP